MAHWPGNRLLVEFDKADALVEAAARVRDAGHGPIEIDSPFPVTGAEEVLELPRPELPWVVFATGLAGGLAGLWIQWFANAWDYPINVGGRALLAWPAWVPVTFELTVLGAALGAVVGLFVATGLPKLWHPAFEVEGFERVTTDRFWLSVGISDPERQVPELRPILEEAGARRIYLVEERP